MGWQYRVSKRGFSAFCCALLVVLGTSQATAQPSKQKAAPSEALQPGEIECLEDQMRIKPIRYTLGLDLINSLAAPQGSGAGAIREGSLIIFVRDASGNTFPIVQRQSSRRSSYAVLCKGEDPKQLARIPTKVRITSQQNGKALSDKLSRLADESWNDLRAQGALPLRRDDKGADFISWPLQRDLLPDQSMLVGLIENYVDAGEHTLLTNDPDGIGVTVLAPANGLRRNWRGATHQPPLATTDGRVPRAPLIVQQPRPPVPLPVQPQPSQSQTEVQTPPPSSSEPRTPAQQTPSSRPSVQADNVPFTIGFQNPAAWKDVKLDDPQMLSTFGYCDEKIERDSRESYRLQCNPGEDGRVPIAIRGFQTLSLNQQEAKQIDTKLDVIGFRQPYPRSWGRGAGALVDVKSGPLLQVLRTNQALDQGIDARCASTIQVSVPDIVAQRIDMREPPCRQYQLVFERGMTDDSAQILSGCLAGAPGARPIQRAQVTCWAQRDARLPLKLKVELLSGFDQLELDIGRSVLDLGGATVGFEQLASMLTPKWPYPGASPFEAATAAGQVPRFVAKTGEYLDLTGQSCGRPLELKERALPSLKEAGCREVPQKAVIVVNQGPATREGPPSKAFKDSYSDTYDIQNARGQRAADIEQLKKPLSVRFDERAAADYKARFRSGNAGAVGGVHVFNGSGEARCGRPVTGKLVSFDVPEGTFTWPLMGAVYSTRGGAESTMLTICAPAKVEEQGGTPYLTFDLEPIVAGGPRRVIIVVNSGALQQGGTTNLVREGLRKLADSVAAERERRAPLSPINVFSMDDKESLRPLFTGEEAARKPADAKRKLSDIDTVAPPTPDLAFLKQQPEIRDNIEKLVLVMDGSAPLEENITQAHGIARRLNQGGGGMTILIKGSCQKWQPEVARGLDCFPLAPADLTKVLGDLVEKRDALRGDLK
jgi:hypothetical protein